MMNISHNDDDADDNSDKADDESHAIRSMHQQ